MIKKIEEALKAGYNLKEGLDEVYSQLSKAGNWGLYDIIGGGFVSSMAKHNHIDQAQQSFQTIGILLSAFEKEMNDVEMYTINIEEIGQGLIAFDCFFDNIFADIMVQSKIEKSMRNVHKAIEKVEKELDNLELKKEEIEKESIYIHQKIEEILKT